MDFKNIKKKIFAALIIAIIIFAGLSLYSDVGKLGKVFLDFDFTYLPIILLLAPLNYLFRYIKWSYYLHLVDIQISHRDSIPIFLSGLAMTITPGKVGEFLKSYLLKEKVHAPISSTAPLVMGERFTDGISVLILAGIGSLNYAYNKSILLIVALMAVFAIGIIQSPALMGYILKVLKKLPMIGRFGSALENFYEKTYIILKWKPLLIAVSIGVVSWFFEGVVIYLTIKALGSQVPLLASVFTVSFSFIVGAASMIPGGLLVTEGSIIGLLHLLGISREMASATTIITRFSTLWLGVFIGLIGLWIVQKSHHDAS
ncbi:uncharacterized protein (TIRG00374 family) [Anaerosolibacter carboniphilus]|uniref:Phosphatidylglycerol lysyltransferase n=1 Tax=Anaerosolibacter carboniphilus TaxID=1417629 RepID=A0A841KZN1_9FIRM|nr:lysylphosphatidylglycerol synthase transmembrane domain-containing protein [Anaerosolibacter carboniphilus]MBB6215599.1 uncharacterized protein (TIRG00374 family) [Anaerosolibacter carboniphilus]